MPAHERPPTGMTPPLPVAAAASVGRRNGRHAARRSTLKPRGVLPMPRPRRGPTKQARILALYPDLLDVEAVARALATSPSYVANTLIEAGHPVAYTDVFTSSRQPVNAYARELAGVLRFKDEASTRACLQVLEAIHAEHAARQDYRGMFQVQQLALLGKLRARALGKTVESDLFAAWLGRH